MLVLVGGMGMGMRVVGMGMGMGEKTEREKMVGDRRRSTGLLRFVFVRILKDSRIHGVRDGTGWCEAVGTAKVPGLLPKVQIPTCSEDGRIGYNYGRQRPYRAVMDGLRPGQDRQGRPIGYP